MIEIIATPQFDKDIKYYKKDEHRILTNSEILSVIAEYCD